jgi:peptidoglycan/LPS O-acetylase OafA/YrhL
MHSQRIFGLDLFRAIAILLVVFSHGTLILRGTHLEGFPYWRMIDGVDFFFVLSGFLIGGILLRQINEENAFGWPALRRFWKRRWYRTLPNYYLILLLNYLFVRNGIISGDIAQFNWSFIVFCQNFVEPFHSFFWESWSLSIEEWFYIFAPLLLALSLPFLQPKFSFVTVVLVLILFPLCYRFVNYDPGIESFMWDLTFRKTVLMRLDSIGYGLLAAWFYYYYKDFWGALKWVSLLLGIGLIAFILIYYQAPNTLYKQTVYFSLSSISVMFLLPVFSLWEISPGYFNRGVTHISKISYSMYLINLALVAEVIKHNFPPAGKLDTLLKYGAYWVIVIVVSSLLYRYFEKPMTNLRDK